MLLATLSPPIDAPMQSGTTQQFKSSATFAPHSLHSPHSQDPPSMIFFGHIPRSVWETLTEEIKNQRPALIHKDFVNKIRKTDPVLGDV